MGFRKALLTQLVVGLLFAVAVSAFAADAHERTQFGRDITVNSGEEVSEVTCFGCSIRIRGHVAGDATSFAGNIVVEDQGEIGGDITNFSGSAWLLLIFGLPLILLGAFIALIVWLVRRLIRPAVPAAA